MAKKAFRAGFTLVELSLSMAFISVLSLAVIVIILSTVSSYRRGIVLSQVNSIGTEIVKDIQSSIKNSSAQTLVSQCESLWSNDDNSYKACSQDGGKSFVSVWRESSVVIDESTGTTGTVPLYGALCTGSYSYIWNSGYLYLGANSSITKAGIRDESGNKLALMGAHTSTAGDLEDGFKLIKVLDSSRMVCESANIADKTIGKNYEKMPNDSLNPIFHVRNAGNDNPPVVLLDKDNDLALYELNTATPVSDDKNNILFYSVSFILGTIRGGPDIRAQGRSCKAPDESSLSDLDYCAINKFNFAAQATGG